MVLKIYNIVKIKIMGEPCHPQWTDAETFGEITFFSFLAINMFLMFTDRYYIGKRKICDQKNFRKF